MTLKKIIIFGFLAQGHINPQINLCKELAAKKVKLIYYCSDKFFPKFDGINNIELRKYPDNCLDYYTKNEDVNLAVNHMARILHFFGTVTEMLAPFTMAEVDREKPDLIICDPYVMWAKMAARFYNVPLALFFAQLMGTDSPPSLASNLNMIKSMILDLPYLIKFLAAFKRMEKKYGKVFDPSSIASHQGKFTMVMTSKEFHPGGAGYPDNVKFIGPSYIEDSIIPDIKDIIFVSRGTMAASDTFWDACMEATKGLGYKVVISFGGNKDNKIKTKNIPDNVKIYDNLSLEEYRNILKQSVLFISHGGFNSICDAILYRTPLIIYPVIPEQIGNGELIQKVGCGITFGLQKVKANILREKIIQLLNDSSLQANLEKYRQSFLNSMGYKKVVEELGKEFDLF
jgi:MGT family glycosyltransferase